MTLEPASSSGDAGGGSELVQLEDITLGAAAGSIDITGIAQTYSHLRVTAVMRGTAVVLNQGLRLRINGDTGNTYSWEQLSAFAGATVVGSESIAQTFAEVMRLPCNLSPANGFGLLEMLIPFYTSATITKNFSSEDQMRYNTGSAMHVGFYSCIWFGTPAAITQLTFFPETDQLQAGCRLTLYGVA